MHQQFGHTPAQECCEHRAKIVVVDHRRHEDKAGQKPEQCGRQERRRWIARQLLRGCINRGDRHGAHDDGQRAHEMPCQRPTLIRKRFGPCVQQQRLRRIRRNGVVVRIDFDDEITGVNETDEQRAEQII